MEFGGGLPEQGIPMRGSTVKLGFQKANNLASLRLNALSSANGMKAPNKVNKPAQSAGFLHFRDF
ncbi:hypothetical protein A5320_21180 [Rheinheimera sp. SA_1]|uniref:hypothetical protein n=1 Tax=Rheinheimera sp. SA_1 TaxID=1827365 RepID=UPI0007FEF29C|nr:hypothetical protein [Rheinheimera sp. SA_1]OBP17062.1 hypothetical protein A5320_21180 [Rheinheimera sp. SA_1]